MTDDRIVGMADAAGGRAFPRGGERDLLAFKSVGTAIQDLALASSVVEAATACGRGREIGELTRLKPFAAPPPDTLSAIAEGAAG
jgi:ornithine cyclodeaminase/alanine dehydrogenase-like protein (mu-crystallin family)